MVENFPSNQLYLEREREIEGERGLKIEVTLIGLENLGWLDLLCPRSSSFLSDSLVNRVTWTSFVGEP